MIQIKVPFLRATITGYEKEYQVYKGDDDRLEVINIKGVSDHGGGALEEEIINRNYELIRNAILTHERYEKATGRVT